MDSGKYLVIPVSGKEDEILEFLRKLTGAVYSLFQPSHRILRRHFSSRNPLTSYLEKHTLAFHIEVTRVWWVFVRQYLSTVYTGADALFEDVEADYPYRRYFHLEILTAEGLESPQEVVKRPHPKSGAAFFPRFLAGTGIEAVVEFAAHEKRCVVYGSEEAVTQMEQAFGEWDLSPERET